MVVKGFILVVGKTRSGKETIKNYIKEAYGIPEVVSYSTRPMRENEVDGREHYFISEERMEEIKKNETMIAYTINDKTGIEYCATVEAMTAPIMTYIINPEGVRYLKEHCPDIKTVILYVDLPEDLIAQRGKERNDSEAVFLKRLASEREEFNAFRESGEWDFLISTIKPQEEVFKMVDEMMKCLNLEKIAR